MKKYISSLFFLLSFSSFAQVIWSADPNQSSNENDFFRRFDGGNYPTDYCYSVGDEVGVSPSSVTTVTDAEHGKVWKVNKPKNRKRGEFARTEGDVNYYAPAEGDDIYIGWRWKIDTKDGATISEEVTVWQWKSAGDHDQNYPLNMEYDGDLTLNAWGPDYANNTSQASMRTVLWRKSVPQDTWVSLVVRIKVDKDDFGGLVEFWFNGEKQQLANSEFNKYQVNLSNDGFTAYHRTNDGSEVYPKWGIYNKKSCSYDANAFFHEMKIGNDLNSAMPSGSLSNQAPSVKVTSPANNAVYTLGETIPLSATASDPDGNLEKVNFKIDDSYYSNDRTAPYTGSFTPTVAGTYKIAARAFDTYDEQVEDFVTVTVVGQNQAPEGSFVLPVVSEINEGYSDLIVEVEASDPDGDAITTTLKINGNVVRSEANAPYEWGHSGSPDYTETLDLSAGEYLFEVEIVDEHGAVTTISKTITVIRVNEAPYIQITYPGEDAVFDLNEEITVSVQATDDIGVDRVNFKLDGAYYAQDQTGDAGEYTASYTFDTPGTYLIGARAFDNEGASTEVSVLIEVREELITHTVSEKNEKLKIYPNPSHGQLYLSASLPWTIMNMQGLEILSGQGDYIDLSAFGKGVFILRAEEKVYKILLE